MKLFITKQKLYTYLFLSIWSITLSATVKTTKRVEYIGTIVYPVESTINLNNKSIKKWQLDDEIKEIHIQNNSNKNKVVIKSKERGFGLDSLAIKQQEITGNKETNNNCSGQVLLEIF